MATASAKAHPNYSAQHGRILSDEEMAEVTLRDKIMKQALFRGEFATAYALLVLAEEVRALGGSILRGRQ